MNKNIWTFPELSDYENEIIVYARENGYFEFFPCINGSEIQARNTLKGAKQFINCLNAQGKSERYFEI